MYPELYVLHILHRTWSANRKNGMLCTQVQTKSHMQGQLSHGSHLKTMGWNMKLKKL